jgi:hypothetical protein
MTTQHDREDVQAWLTDLMPQIMASGALYALENAHEFRGSTASLSSHFEAPAKSWMGIRGGFEIDRLMERLDSPIG